MHAFYYPPKNPNFAAPAGDKPPLIVLTHGGPTAATEDALDPEVQFWTSRGFAILDVNYSGSTGYGRAYRDRLKGQWGIADVEDAVGGAQAMVAQGKADANRLIIRGGSAGGYTTLAALTFHRTFKAGRQLLRHQRHRSPGARHAQVRVALSRFADRARIRRRRISTCSDRRFTSPIGCRAR